MRDLDGVLIVGFIVLGIYKVIELFARRRERLNLIEKLSVRVEQGECPLPVLLDNPNRGAWSLRIALLFIGVGIGCLLSIFTSFWTEMLNHGLNQVLNRHYMQTFVNFACIAIFGGLGLLTSYLIELRQSRKKKGE